MSQDNNPQAGTVAELQERLKQLDVKVDAALRALSADELRKLIAEIEASGGDTG